MLDRLGLVKRRKAKSPNRAPRSITEYPERYLLACEGLQSTRADFAFAVFAGQTVGIREVDDQIWLVSFLDYDLGLFDQDDGRLEPTTSPFTPDKVLTVNYVPGIKGVTHVTGIHRTRRIPKSDRPSLPSGPTTARSWAGGGGGGGRPVTYVTGALLIAVAIQSAAMAMLVIRRAWRKRVEQVLKKSEERYRFIADRAPVMIWTARRADPKPASSW